MLMLDCQVMEGERPPIGYGLAWINYNEKTTTFIIIPFNWIACFFRWIYFTLRKGHPLHNDIELKSMMRKAFHDGYISGKQDGYKLRNAEIESNIAAYENGHLAKVIREYINGERQPK